MKQKVAVLGPGSGDSFSSSISRKWTRGLYLGK